MQNLSKEFIQRVESVLPKESLEIVQNIFDDLMRKCVSFHTEREAVVVLDEKWRIVDIDKIFTLWFESEREEVVGKYLKDIF